MAAKPTPKRPYDWNSRIKAALRKIWLYSPERRAVLKRAGSEAPTAHVVCFACGEIVHAKLAAVDHAEPIVPVAGFDSWDAVIRRLQFGQQNVLCNACHKTKTKAENTARRAAKKKVIGGARKRGNKA